MNSGSVVVFARNIGEKCFTKSGRREEITGMM